MFKKFQVYFLKCQKLELVLGRHRIKIWEWYCDKHAC